MAIAEVFPYSDQHNLNLDWILAKIKEFSGNQISSIAVTQLDTDTIKFSATYTDGSSRDLGSVDLPAGPQGPTGPTGATGATGATPNLTAGTVTTLSPGSDATISITGTAEDPVLNMGIPQGATGAAGGIVDIDGYTGSVTTGTGIAFDTSTGALSSYDFNLTNTGVCTITSPAITNTSSWYTSISYAFNSDYSIGKIYGIVGFVVADAYSGGNTAVSLDTGITVPAPQTAYYIRGGSVVSYKSTAANKGAFANEFFYIDTAGKVYINFTITNSFAGASFVLDLPSCIYFFKDFGDPGNRMMRQLGDIIEDPIQEER